MTELARLAETAGSQVLDGLIQRRSRPDPATFIGSGKVAELGDAVRAAGADTVICDGELSPGQLRQLEDKLKVKVIDRTALILDIFAQHARSRDGKAQVELAQLSYLLPRLRGWGEALSRQVGGRAAGGVGIGGRGPGETKIELDRRRIRHRMSKLRRDIAAMRQVRDDPARRAPPPRGAERRDRRLHQRRQVEPAQRADRGGRAGRGRAVRHPRPDDPPRRHRGRAGLHAHRHRRVRPAPAAPARRGVPLDAGGDGRGGPARARRRRLGPAAGGPDRGRPPGARRDRRGAGGRMPHELLVVNKTDAAGDLALARLRHLLPDAVFVSARRGDGIERLRARIAELLPQPGAGRRAAAAVHARARSRRGCTPRARCSPRSTPPRAPGCTPGSGPSSPRRCCRSPASATRSQRVGARGLGQLSLPALLAAARGRARPGAASASRPDRSPRR